MSRPIYPALVGEVARLGRSKTGDNQQRDDQRHEAGSSHEGTSRLMIEITNVTWDGERDCKAPGRAAAVHQCRSWHVCDIARWRMDVRFRWKSGRAVDIAAMTEFDPE